MAPRRDPPTFRVRFVAKGLTPAKVPLRLVSDALEAIQDLAAARDAYETRKVPDELVVGLVNVRRGSACYDLRAQSPGIALTNLGRTGNLLAAESLNDDLEDMLVAAIEPIRKLSRIAKAIDGSIEVLPMSNIKQALFEITSDAFRRLSSSMLIEGATRIVAEVLRVGGATESRCMLGLPGRTKKLFCSVDPRIAKRLGRCLYATIYADGDATWLAKNWRLHDFRLREFRVATPVTAEQAHERLRKAGLDAWDDVPDPAAFLRELRQ